MLSASLLAVVPVKCNSIFAKRNLAADDGYEYVMVTGSSVPMRVQKGKSAVPNAPVSVTSGEALRNFTQSHTNVPHLPGGGN